MDNKSLLEIVIVCIPVGLRICLFWNELSICHPGCPRTQDTAASGASGSIHLILQCMYCFRMQTSGRCREQEEHPCFPGSRPRAMPGCSLFSNAKHFIVKSESCQASTKHVKPMLESSADVLCGCGTVMCALLELPPSELSFCVASGFPRKTVHPFL